MPVCTSIARSGRHLITRIPDPCAQLGDFTMSNLALISQAGSPAMSLSLSSNKAYVNAVGSFRRFFFRGFFELRVGWMHLCLRSHVGQVHDPRQVRLDRYPLRAKARP